MSMDQFELSNALYLVRQTYETLTNKTPSDKVIDSWKIILEPLDYDLVNETLLDWLKNQTFPPKPVDICNAVRAKQATIQATQQEAKDWGDPADMSSPYMKRLMELIVFSDTNLPSAHQNVRVLLWRFLNNEKLDRFQYDYLIGLGALAVTENGYQVTGKFQPAKARTWAEESGALARAKDMGIMDHILHSDKTDPEHNRYFDARGNAVFPAEDPAEEDFPF